MYSRVLPGSVHKCPHAGGLCRHSFYECLPGLRSSQLGHLLGPEQRGCPTPTPSSFLRGLSHSTTSAEGQWGTKGTEVGQIHPAHGDAPSGIPGAASLHPSVEPALTSLSSSAAPSPQSQRSNGWGTIGPVPCQSLHICKPPSPLTLS